MSFRLKQLPKVPRGERYDLVIVGAGPAGLSAGIYAARFMLKTLIVSEDVGGQLNLTSAVDDYPGMGSVSASELVSRFRKHAEESGVQVVAGVRVEDIARVEEGLFKVVGSRRLEVYAPAVILAVGSRRRKLGVPGEDRLAGRGVSYCSICDAPLFRGRKAVVVVGGGDAALEGALMLSDYVEKVYLVHRRDSFRAKPVYVARVKSRANIEFVLNSVVEEILGDERVTGVVVRNRVTGETKTLSVDGVFVEIGLEPPTEWFRKLGLEVDEKGYVKVDEWMRTSVPGIFAAGDCTSMWHGFRQIVTASAMGAVAAYSAYNYLIEHGLVSEAGRKA
ncbi:MAG: thioredoxin-disulfide reductase [Thermoproteota archaeon]